MIPDDGKYAIELVGELAGLLALGASQNEQSRPEAARLTLRSTVMVAGAGFGFWRTFLPSVRQS